VNLLPRSIPGQLALVMACALLVASLINFVLLISERQRALQIERSGPVIARFADIAVDVFSAPPAVGERLTLTGRRQGPGGRFQLSRRSLIEQRGLERDVGLEMQLSNALEAAGLAAPPVQAGSRLLSRMDGSGTDERGRPPPADGPPVRARLREIILSAQLPDGRWFNSTTVSAQVDGHDEILLGASTIVTFIFVLGAALLVARQVSKPLRNLAEAAARVGAGSEPEQVAVQGYGDVRQTLEAFNAMSRRVSQLLEEKDVMLGALGHDLRTPLASLRIRLETMEPEAERQKAIRTIEETTQLLNDILELSRKGRSREPERTMDLSILIEDIIENYTDTGAPVALSGREKSPVRLRPVLFARAVRNLIDNAIAYGGSARVFLERSDGDLIVRIEDDGPGMSEAFLSRATAPFEREDASRSRRTGGAGLGLTLADAIVRAHGGELTLRNRSAGGLEALIRLPEAGEAGNQSSERPLVSG